MKILVIGDIHGRSNWKFKGDIIHLVKFPNLATDYDKYIFLGDYTDSFTETNAVILHNLKEIIQLKKNYPDKVILLLGNHDLQYMFNYKEHGCSGYRPEMYQELHQIFNENKDLFLPAYQIQNYLFTHAGVTTTWIRKRLYEDESLLNLSIYDIINKLFKDYDKRLFDVGRCRGGYYLSGGPFWADKYESSNAILPNYHQVVGHHPVNVAGETITLDDNSSITYVDDNKTGHIELEITKI
ncbi:MAG: metallophosphoesterase [Methanogenium sp.]|jgi:predicted MPP superfamily phosphohydrolase